MDNTLSNDTNNELRNLGIITRTEVAIESADLFLAEDVITKSRRIIQVPTYLAETARGKRILRG
jgi:hypothetical protein|tara:strand:+ start:3341 stop:3532 length:192 start_codon:yes stop_codon:yes gene_type:complete